MSFDAVMKRTLRTLPPVKRRLQAMEEMRDIHLTERMLAHSAPSPLPQIKFVSVPASNQHNKLGIAKRLIASYHCALKDEKNSPLKREGEDLWSGLIRGELQQLLSILERRNPEELANFLTTFSNSYVWFGGVTTCIDAYNKHHNPDHVPITYLDKLVALAESIGVLPVENPENGPWGDALGVDLGWLTGGIEAVLGTHIDPPLGIIHTDGIETPNGVFHYRHINSLYAAIRLSRLCKQGASVCEIGGGIGLTAMYASRLGIARYTILDLPITCLLAGHYLLHAVGEKEVVLYGEKPENTRCIQVLPYWRIADLPQKSFDLVLNQDSLPEISDNLVAEYLNRVPNLTAIFLSINQEYFHPRTVHAFVSKLVRFRELYRTKCWVREGYVEEAFEILDNVA